MDDTIEVVSQPSDTPIMYRDFTDYSLTELALTAIVLMMFFRLLIDLFRGRL